jgi:hypothetical protein
MSVDETICKPLFVKHHDVRAEQVASVIDEMANLPRRMVAMDMISRKLMPEASFEDKQECLNRLCQRWRKLGLMRFERGRWVLTHGSWDRMQAAAIRARLNASGMEARQGQDPQGLDGEAATARPDAQPPAGDS